MDCKPRSRGCSFVLSFPSDAYSVADISSSSRSYRSSSSVYNSVDRTADGENCSAALQSSVKLVRRSSWKSKPTIPVRMNMSSIIRICTKDGTDFNSRNLAGLMNANEQRRLKTICAVYGRARERMEELQQKSSSRQAAGWPASISADAKAKFLVDNNDGKSRNHHDANNDKSRSGSFRKSSSLESYEIKSYPRHKSISVPFSELKEFLEHQIKLYSTIDNRVAIHKPEFAKPSGGACSDSAKIESTFDDAKSLLPTKRNDRCHSPDERRKLRTSRHHRYRQRHHRRQQDTVTEDVAGSSLNSYQPVYDRIDCATHKNCSADADRTGDDHRGRLDLKNISDMANKLRDLGFSDEANSIQMKIDGTIRERKPSGEKIKKYRHRLRDGSKLDEETDQWISKLIGFLDGN